MPNAQHMQKDLLAQMIGKEAACAIEDLFSKHGEEAVKKSAFVVAEVFDSASIFEQLTENPSEMRDKTEKKLIKSFHKNLTLLVQKTWVEKCDEALKEQVLFQLDGVCAALEEKKYAAVYEKFMLLLHDTVYLLFGPQSKKDDFGEYALRIDPDFGVFWQFLQKISPSMPKSEHIGRMYILLGMCFLANY
ncbi:hypothetical protein H0R92_06795 [Treponema sp. OMZ 840]|uniref:hypothetical protein n=1 Tax=Treponema sp. OMZ 840 TaxID=244313 RepID=UPI003D8D371E